MNDFSGAGKKTKYFLFSLAKGDNERIGRKADLNGTNLDSMTLEEINIGKLTTEDFQKMKAHYVKIEDEYSFRRKVDDI